jgi:hypothetical protein
MMPTEAGARQRNCRAALEREPGKEGTDMDNVVEPSADSNRISYVLAELRCASLRARLAQHDIEAVGLALKGKLIGSEQAVELLADCDCLRLIAPERAHDLG